MSTEEWSSTIDTAMMELDAKQAYSQHRLRECFRLINDIRAIQPDNETATTLQATIGGDLDQLLNEVRALMEERQTGSIQGRLCAAEVMLKKVLDIDPSHKGAHALMQATKAMAKKFEPGVQQGPTKLEVPFTVAPGPVAKKQEKQSFSYRSVLFVAAILTAGGFVFARQLTFKSPQQPNTASALPAPGRPTRTSLPAPAPAFAAPARSTVPAAVPVASQSMAQIATSGPATLVTKADAVPVARSTKANIVVTAKPDPVSPVEFGSLAISSPVATDVYSGEQYMGATPLTLQLPPGSQTLEYRHGNLRKSVTHQIRASETTTALITFDVVVQINAKPWANVFIDGSDRQPLGQTPLSDVHVPIGKVLIFENPKYPAKSYRITGNETAVQIVFP